MITFKNKLTKKQQEHLRKALRWKEKEESVPCRHDECTQCYGTGVKINGERCVHYLSCNCPKHQIVL